MGGGNPVVQQGGPSDPNGPLNAMVGGPTMGGANPPNPQTAAGPLDPTQRPMFGAIDLRGALRAPRTAMGNTRDANSNASALSGQGVCRGYVATAPSFAVRVSQPQAFLRFFVNSAADTTMVIQRPDGSLLCDDDSGGHLQPMIDGSYGPGTYFVWVGIYRAGMGHPFRLTITNDSNAHP
jgi:hypothetical protein